MNRSSEEIYNALIKNKDLEKVVTLTYEELIDLYKNYKKFRETKVIIVEMINSYFIKFPQISNMQIRIEKKDEEKIDFKIFSNQEKIIPYNLSKTFFKFIINEFKINKIILLLLSITIISIMSFLKINIDFIYDINKIYVTVMTIFITIFLVFTTSNTFSNYGKGELNSQAFINGWFYERLENDKHIVKLAFFSLFSTLINLMILASNLKGISQYYYTLNILKNPLTTSILWWRLLLGLILTIINFNILVILFRTIIDYYFVKKEKYVMGAFKDEFLRNR
jgi:hypothetical protein